MSTKTPAQRLGEAVYHRRMKELDVTQMDISDAGGPSNTTLTTIENGRLPSLNRKTAQKLDKGLRWEPGSAMRVWLGEGDPTPVGGDQQDPGYVSSPGATAERSVTDADVLRRLDAVEEALRELLENSRRSKDT